MRNARRATTMSKRSTTKRTVLARRTGDGLDVTLVWARRDGTDEVVVRVADVRDGQYFEIPAEPARALDVFYHPFAHQGVKTADDAGRRAA